jgi:hypothetical protein
MIDNSIFPQHSEIINLKNFFYSNKKIEEMDEQLKAEKSQKDIEFIRKYSYKNSHEMINSNELKDFVKFSNQYGES